MRAGHVTCHWVQFIVEMDSALAERRSRQELVSLGEGCCAYMHWLYNNYALVSTEWGNYFTSPCTNGFRKLSCSFHFIGAPVFTVFSLNCYLFIG